MAQFTDAQVQQTLDTCREHLVELAETFRTTLDCAVRFSAGAPAPVADSAALTDFQVPGLVVSVVVGEQGLLVLIPQNLPLPTWYREPDESQDSQLQTLAQELSRHFLPAEIESDRYIAVATENLIEVAQSAQAASSAKMVVLSVVNPNGTHEAAFAKLLVIVPVDAPPLSAAAAAATTADTSAAPSSLSEEAELDSTALDDDAAVAEEAAAFAVSVSEADDAQARAVAADAALRALRILRVPVTVSVRLAERKMSLGAVVALVPGSLVTFNKSCEDLLDLYVNNHRYCQGEAIKIGESFGLKISRVGVTEEPKQRII